jgi:hypothetical protein
MGAVALDSVDQRGDGGAQSRRGRVMDRHDNDNAAAPLVSVDATVSLAAERARGHALHVIVDKLDLVTLVPWSGAFLLGSGLRACDDLSFLPSGMLANLRQIVALGMGVNDEDQQFWDVKRWVRAGRVGDVPTPARMARKLSDLTAAIAALHCRAMAWLAAAAVDAGQIELVSISAAVRPVAGRTRGQARQDVGDKPAPAEALVIGCSLLGAGLRACCDDLPGVALDVRGGVLAALQQIVALGVAIGAARGETDRADDVPAAVRLAPLLADLAAAISTMHAKTTAWLVAVAADAGRIDHAAAELIAGRAVVSADLWGVFATNGGADGA